MTVAPRSQARRRRQALGGQAQVAERQPRPDLNESEARAVREGRPGGDGFTKRLCLLIARSMTARGRPPPLSQGVAIAAGAYLPIKFCLLSLQWRSAF